MVSHLAACPACRELALAWREALAEGMAREGVPPVIEAAVRDALRARRRPRTDLSGRARPRLRALLLAGAVSAISVPLAFHLLGRVRAGPPDLLGRVVPVPWEMERRGFGEGAVRPGSRFRLRVDVREAGRLYALLRWRTDGTSRTAWLSPPEGTEDVLDPERVSPGTHHIPGFVPEEAVEASVLILTSREPIQRLETKDLERVAESAEPWRGLVELAGRLDGEPALVELFPPDPRAELERVLEGGDALALRSFVDFRPEGAAAVTASLLEEGLAEGGGNSEAFAKAERVARAWKEVRDSGILLDRVDWYRALARSPEALRTRRDLDGSIRRDLAVHDQNIGIARGTRLNAEAVKFFASCAREYRERGDVWGEIESGLRRAWNEPSGGRRSAAFREAVELSRAFAYPRGEGLALFGLGFDASSRNPTSLAEIRALYAASARILRSIRLEEPLGVAANNLGHQCNKEGFVGEAFGHLEEAVRTLRKIGSRRDEAIARQNLGRAFEIVGRTKEAVNLFEDSELTLRKLREGSAGAERIVQIYEARAAARAARALVQVGDFEKANGTARRAISLAMALPEPDHDQEALSWARLALAEIEMRRGSYVTAAQLAEAAASSSPGYAWRTGEALLGRGLALQRLGRYTDAADAFAQARERIEGVVGDGPLSADVLLATAGLQEDQGRIKEALTTLEQWLRYARALLDSQGLSAERRATLRDRLRPGFVAGVRLALERERQGDPDAASLAFRFFETVRPRSLARLARRAVSEESPPGAVLSDLERVLGDGAMLLEYLYGEKTSYVLVASARGQTVHSLGVPGDVLEERASDLRRAITEGFPIEEVERAGRAAWDVFLSPVAAEVTSSNLLVVSHDPKASPFPFEALVPGRDPEFEGSPPFLLRSAAVAYVPSAAVLVEIYDRAHAPAPDRHEPSQPFLALGDPSSCLELPNARSEVEGIARLFPDGAEVRIGAAADEGFAKSGRLSEFRVVHFAAHAYVSEEPALALARSPGEDGILTASEASSLPTLGADLLALSTCGPDGGISEEAPWEAGLPAAFLSNGAASVLSPLWPVTDAATAQLMVRFYEGIARGIPRLEALRRARLAFLDGLVVRPPERVPGPAKPSDAWSHPVHWAAFVLEGSPR